MKNMTFEEFKIKVERKTSFDKYWYYSISVIIIIMGVAAMIFAIKNPEKFKDAPVIAYTSFLFLVALGLSSFYFLPNRYKIVEIDSNLSSDDKRVLINRLANEIGFPTYSTPKSYFVFRTKSKWWQSSFGVHFFYDETKFAFSLQGSDYNGGFIDFGESERKRKFIVNRIQELAV